GRGGASRCRASGGSGRALRQRAGQALDLLAEPAEPLEGAVDLARCGGLVDARANVVHRRVKSLLPVLDASLDLPSNIGRNSFLRLAKRLPPSLHGLVEPGSRRCCSSSGWHMKPPGVDPY